MPRKRLHSRDPQFLYRNMHETQNLPGMAGRSRLGLKATKPIAESVTGGGPAEGFRANMDGGSAGAGGSFTQPTWDWSSQAWTYHTSGVALSGSDVSVDLPAGFWILSLQFDVFTNSAATSGEFQVGMFNDDDGFDGAGERKRYTSWPSASSRANFHITHHTYLPSAGSFSVFYINGLNVAGTITGQWSATQVAGTGSVTFGTAP